MPQPSRSLVPRRPSELGSVASESYRAYVIRRLEEVFFHPLSNAGWDVGGLSAVPPNTSVLGRGGLPALSIQVFHPSNVVGINAIHRQTAREAMPNAALILTVDFRDILAEDPVRQTLRLRKGNDSERLDWEKFESTMIALKDGEDPVPLVASFLRQFARLKLAMGGDKPGAPLALPQS